MIFTAILRCLFESLVKPCVLPRQAPILGTYCEYGTVIYGKSTIIFQLDKLNLSGENSQYKINLSFCEALNE